MSTYIDSGATKFDPAFDWWEHTLRNLTWRYGPERARAIFNGEDLDAQDDQRKWRQFGRKDAA